MSMTLYVYTGNFVRAFNSRMEEDKALGRPLNEFLAVCDKKFAYKGLAYMREYLEERLKNYDSATDEIIQLTDTMISEQKR